MSRTRRAASGSATAALRFGLHAALQIVLYPLLLAHAGQEMLGAYSMLVQAVGYLVVADLGFNLALARQLAHAHAGNARPGLFDDVLTTGRTFQLFSNGVFSVLALLLILALGPVLHLPPPLAREGSIALGLLAVWSLVRTPFTPYASALFAVQELAATNLLALFGNALRLVLSIVLVVYGGRVLGGLVGLMLAQLAADSLILIGSAVIFWRKYPHRHAGWGIPDRPLFFEMLRYGRGTLLLQFASRLIFTSDTLVAGWLNGPASASVFYTTEMPAMLGYTFIFGIIDNLQPALHELTALGDRARLRALFLRLTRYALALGLCYAAGVIFFNRAVVTLWVGRSQYGGSGMTLALGLFALCVVVEHLHSAFVQALGDLRTFGRLTLLEGAVNLGLSILLGKLFGLAGVLIASLIATLPTLTWLVTTLARDLGVPLRALWNEVARPACLVLCAALCAGAAGLWAPPSAVAQVARMALFVAAFAAALLRFGMGADERSQLRGLLGRLGGGSL